MKSGLSASIVRVPLHRVADHFMLMAHYQSNLHFTPWPRAIGVAPEGRVMSQCSKMKHRRTPWKEQAKQRGKGERYERREKARMKAERDRLTHALKASEARVHALEAQRNGLATRPKVDVVYLALQLFLEARISFRAHIPPNLVVTTRASHNSFDLSAPFTRPQK